MTPDHPDAFVDMTVLPVPTSSHLKVPVPCPVCRTYGGWNLRLNAYPLHGRSDTPENRSRFCHFRASCRQCNGWGYVEKGSTNETCIHDLIEQMGYYSMHEHRYECRKCGLVYCTDSSD